MADWAWSWPTILMTSSIFWLPLLVSGGGALVDLHQRGWRKDPYSRYERWSLRDPEFKVDLVQGVWFFGRLLAVAVFVSVCTVWADNTPDPHLECLERVTVEEVNLGRDIDTAYFLAERECGSRLVIQ